MTFHKWGQKLILFVQNKILSVQENNKDVALLAFSFLVAANDWQQQQKVLFDECPREKKSSPVTKLSSCAEKSKSVLERFPLNWKAINWMFVK